jgi:hypothetical protein
VYDAVPPRHSRVWPGFRCSSSAVRMTQAIIAPNNRGISSLPACAGISRSGFWLLLGRIIRIDKDDFVLAIDLDVIDHGTVEHRQAVGCDHNIDPL